MKAIILSALYLLSFTGCAHCELEEDEAKYDTKVKNDTLNIKPR